MSDLDVALEELPRNWCHLPNQLSVDYADGELADPFGDFDAEGLSGRPTINGVIRHCLTEGKLGEILSKATHPTVDDGFHPVSDDRRAKALVQLAHCRRGGLGARQYDCDGCGAQAGDLELVRRSALSAVCAAAALVWHQKVLSWSLDCDYLHAVATLPHEFNPLVAANSSRLRLFDCVRRSIL